jgi:hypothetical protein
VKQDIGHLSDAQIEESASKSPGEISPSVEAHLSECEVCLDRLLESQRTRFSFLESHGMRTEAYPDCPQPEVLQEIAAEGRTPESSGQVLKHAAQCDYCGPLFNRYLQDFSDDYTPEFKTVLQALPSQQERKQRDRARQLAAQARGEKQSSKPGTAVMPWPFWKKAVAWATPLAAALLVAVGAGPALMARFELHRDKGLVAKAYAAQRTTEMQLAGMPYGKYADPHVTLGPGGRDVENESPELLDARRAMNERTKSGKPLDSDHLEMQGQLSLLEGNPVKAERTLKDALTGSADPAAVMIDLAATYYNRGDYARAIDTLSTAIEHPKASEQEKSAAMFDLAVTYQKAEMWDLAATTLKKYLARESSGGWADEARSRLADAEKKLQFHQQRGQIVITAPAEFLANINTPAVQRNIEEYVDVALSYWLSPPQEAANDFFLPVRS